MTRSVEKDCNLKVLQVGVEEAESPNAQQFK